MKFSDLCKVDNGLYEITWKKKQGGGTSLAAIGRDARGVVWIAPTNWLGPLLPGTNNYREHIDAIKSLTPVARYGHSIPYTK